MKCKEIQGERQNSRECEKEMWREREGGDVEKESERDTAREKKAEGEGQRDNERKITRKRQSR